MDIFNKCAGVLEKNWKGKFTIPSPRLYPFQWNWDSGFIAIGNLYSQPERSIIEIETLFDSQWQNGFLPHIIFHNEEKYTSYFPSADYWNSQINDLAPKNVKTSGITQPPVHGFVLEKMYKLGFDHNRLSTLFDKIISYHKYLYENRQFNNSGLVVIWHNWESGMDNSIWWDDVLNKIPEKKLVDITLKRKDVNEVKESDQTRPKDLDYKRYLYLLNTLKENKYNSIPVDFPFQIIDPVFNTILIQSNLSLIKIGEQLGKNISFLKNKTEVALENFSKYLWNDNDQLYYAFDILQNEQIIKHCSGCYIPIFAKIPENNQVINLIKRLKADEKVVPIPSTYINENGFERKNYWRGPVWVNINWMVWKGLLKYGLTKEANFIAENTVRMVKKYGCYEYFDPYINAEAKAGYGGNDFSWTAALIIDMIKSEKI